MLTASNIHYDVSGRTRGLTAGGIGAMHLLVQHTGPTDAPDQEVHVLKRHLPYHESVQIGRCNLFGLELLKGKARKVLSGR